MSRLIATYLGIGYLPVAPGTWGSAASIPLAWVIHAVFGLPGFLIATILITLVGWWATAKYTRDTENHDPSEVVIDEVAGMFVALLPLSAGLWFADVGAWTFPWPGWLAAFVLFRIFDMAKPGPVGWADRRDDAFGVMLDDLIAGAMAAICVAIGAYLSHGVLGI